MIHVQGLEEVGASEGATPAQKYQPVVSPTGTWRSPWIGFSPERTCLAMPTLR
jgi:hypothetical protein